MRRYKNLMGKSAHSEHYILKNYEFTNYEVMS